MAEKRNETFTVTDRRLFTSEGELRKDVTDEPETFVASRPAPAPTSTQEVAEPPSASAAEQQQQADAYQKSSEEMDRQVGPGNHLRAFSSVPVHDGNAAAWVDA